MSLRPVTAPAPANDVGPALVDQWDWFERQSGAKAKAAAARRAAILMEVETYVAGGARKTSAIEAAARRHGVSPRAVAGWFALVKGVPMSDRLPRLALRYKGGGKQSEIDAEIWRDLLSDFLRLSGPSWATCVRRSRFAAERRGLTLPCDKTLLRRLRKQVRRDVVMLLREGRVVERRPSDRFRPRPLIRKPATATAFAGPSV